MWTWTENYPTNIAIANLVLQEEKKANVLCYRQVGCMPSSDAKNVTENLTPSQVVLLLVWAPVVPILVGGLLSTTDTMGTYSVFLQLTKRVAFKIWQAS